MRARFVPGGEGHFDPLSRPVSPRLQVLTRFVPVAGRDTKPMRTARLLDQTISVPSGNMGIYSAVAVIESALSKRAGEPVHVITQEWLNRIRDLKVSFPSRPGPARDLLLTVIRTTHYRFYWLAREQPFRDGWASNLMPLDRPNCERNWWWAPERTVTLH